MKYIRIFLFSLFFMPTALFAANSEFMVAAQLLAAARNADIQQVQVLVNNGADINFVDSTGLSIVCTALMNNDVRAAQILQMYGADASKCDQQIKKYNSRNKKERSGGLFSGLSSAHTLTLAAAGAAVVVGGLLLLTDAFDGGGGHSSSGGGDRPNNGGDNGGSSGGTATAAITIPYGPAMPNAESETANYTNNLNYYSPSVDGIIKDNFTLMNNLGGGQNYLLLMHGYSALARGYMGMRTLRGTGNIPVPSSTLGLINIKGITVGGGRPVGVAMVTANGIDAAPKPAGAISAQKNSLDDKLLAWTTISGDTVVNNPEISNLASKYYNNLIVLGGAGAEISNSYTTEDKNFLSDFDLSGSGTAINNTSATVMDNLLAKIVGGSDSGYATADYFGFMPNGQMGIFRTGAGHGFIAVETQTQVGTYTMVGTALASGDTLNLGDGNLTVVRDGNMIIADAFQTVAISNGTVTGGDKITVGGQELTVVSVNGMNVVATATVGSETVKYDGYIVDNTLYVHNASSTTAYSGYIGGDGLLYMTAATTGAVAKAYSMTENKLILTKEYGDIDYMNYKALLKAGAMWYAGDLNSGGRSRMDVIANSSVIAPLHSRDSQIIDDILANPTESNFAALVDKYYDRNQTDGTGGTNAKPSTDAISFFQGLGSTYSPLVLFSTGASENSVGWGDAAQVASFENAAPLVFKNLEHLFASVVAVGITGTGTSDATSVSGFSSSGKIALAQWSNNNGTADDSTDDKYYKARVCGIAGRGANGIDPWCFASAGLTDELAVASAAGAAGAIKSAFSYMNNKQLFTLLALTADGPYMATTTDGNSMTRDDVKAYLQSMYQLPPEYQYRVDNEGTDYLDVFKEVFGYGLINLERATKPGTQIFLYDASTQKIVTASGNAYWRAASNTVFRPSSAFNLRGASISAPFYDVIESVDGDLKLPRVWQNEFALDGAGRRRGLNLDDVFDDLSARNNSTDTQIGDMHFSMAMSPRAYDDNMNGLDYMRISMSRGDWDLAAEYQHKFTDGARLFSAAANPILSLASDAVVTDAVYNLGKWHVGARAFSGSITDRALLENDPTVTSQYTPARLGLMRGGAFDTGWRGGNAALDASFGFARETDTLLGAQTGGLLNLGGGDTMYVDVTGRYSFANDVDLIGRASFARTAANATGQYIIGMDDIYSNSFAVGLQFGGFEFFASQPLAVRSGKLQYSHADYSVIETDDGKFDIVAENVGVREIGLRALRRETRFSGMYKHKFGEFTDGAFGFIYRINPDNTDEFGNESVFMLKMTHRVGI